MKYLLTAILIIGLLTPYSANAKDLGWTVGTDGIISFPMSEWADKSNTAFGALVTFEKNLDQRLLMTARVGYIFSLKLERGNMERSTTHFPLMAGVKHKVVPDYYLAGELGFLRNYYKSEESALGFSTINSHAEYVMGMSLGGGYLYRNWDFRFQWFFPDLADLGEMHSLMFSVGRQFTSF